MASRKEQYLTLAKAAGDRALRTFFQTLIVSLPGAAIASGVFDWKSILIAVAASAGAAGLSALTSIATGLPEEGLTVVGTQAVAIGRHAAPDAE